MRFQLSAILAFVLVGASVPLLMLTLGWLVRPRVPDAAKLDTYECGELPSTQAWFNFNPRFYDETRKRTKTNLMVFLRPQVLRDEASTENVASQHYGRVQREQSRVAVRDRQMPGEASPPQLPGSAQSVPSSAEAKPVAGPETNAQ